MSAHLDRNQAQVGTGHEFQHAMASKDRHHTQSGSTWEQTF